MTRIKRFDASIEQRHYLALKRRVKCGITRLAKYFNMNDQRQRKYYNLLRGTQVETLLLGRVGVLRNLARKFDRYLPPGEFWNAKSPAYNKDFAALSHRVRKAFRYEGFRDGKDEKGMWCGWALAREYSKVVKYCPYCNSETLYAFEWIDDKGNRRLSKSAFDHYFPRARYPYLGLSLYNLIPSCTRCNSSLKGDFGDSLVSTAHPFGDDLDSLMKFHILPKCRAAFYESSAAGIAHIVLAERQSGQSDKGVDGSASSAFPILMTYYLRMMLLKPWQGRWFSLSHTKRRSKSD